MYVRTLVTLVAVCTLAGGCGGSNDCVRACKHWEQCFGEAGPPSSWTCPLSAACSPAEECRAACIQAASCGGLNRTDPAATVPLDQCRATCGATPPGDGLLPDQGPRDLPPPPPDQRLDKPQQLDVKPPPPDQYVWPDLPKQQDQFVWPDTYAGAPFGCVTDAECFGLVCCKTPWGISICAQQCF